jgi:signal transduction histidine kinase
VRSIRVRLLFMLLLLVTFVVVGLSWYVYEQSSFLLKAKELATAELIRSHASRRSQDCREKYFDQMVRQAERIGRQVYERVEFTPAYSKVYPYQALEFASLLSCNFANPLSIPQIPVTLSQGGSIQDSRVAFIYFAKRTIVLTERVLDGDEHYYIWTPRASARSSSLPSDCFSSQVSSVQNIELYQPDVQEEVLKCGKRFCMVSIKMPMAYETFATGSWFQLGRPLPPRRSTGRISEQRSSPRPLNTLVVQVAKETEHRDRELDSYREEMNHELSALTQETEIVRKDTLNRLILICLATIALCALAITWLSRSSLAPLVNVADAVTDLTPKDLRLKLNGTELDHRKMPEELAPIVLRLQESLESLHQAFQREKRATADISHELRTPLASLMTTMQVALRKPRSVDEYKSTLTQCIETGSHMKTLVERLLMLSRLDAGVDALRQEPVDVVELAGQCVDMLRPLADQRQIAVELEVDASAENLPPQLSDAGKLREILVNLIDNAVHYNKECGQVTVKITAAPKAVVLEVSDSGVGMSDETRAHLFERFFRADPSRQSTTINAGLGLAIVKGYVDLFGGTISVTSAEGEGTTFRITLPRKEVPQTVMV